LLLSGKVKMLSSGKEDKSALFEDKAAFVWRRPEAK
jgi:hypothetical protein